MPLSFGEPRAFVLLALLLLLALLFWRGRRRRRAQLTRFAQPVALAALSNVNLRQRRRAQLCLAGGVICLVVALAAPRWGKGDPGVVSGRDLMITLDLSKSMLADDMRGPSGRDKERWQAARRSIHELVDSIRQRGGHRVGLVVFAAKPWLVCPLTSDYDHFLMRLDEYCPQSPPPEVNPLPDETFPSGTRIGAGVAEAVKWHDPRFQGYQDVLLISDGDDPAEAEKWLKLDPKAVRFKSEIDEGIEAAEKAKIPVHVVGVGDPGKATEVSSKRPERDDEFQTCQESGPTKREDIIPEFVRPTHMVEAPLKEIAEKTRGEYLPAHSDRPNLAEFFRTRIENRPSRELPDDALPQPKDRAVWFLLAALVLLLAGWAWEW